MSSSSPDLPSPSTFFSRKVSSALRSGSRAAQVPDGAITGFATASSLIESHQLSLSVEEFPAEQKAKRQRGSLAQVDANTRAPPKKQTKRSTTKAPQPNDDSIPKRPRKKDAGILDKDHSNIRTFDCPLATTKLSEASIPASIEEVDISAPKSAPSKQRKPRRPKAKSEAQTKLKKGRITKPGGRSMPSKNIDLSQDGAIEVKLTGAVAKHFLRKQSPGVTRNNDYQILKTESPPTVEGFGKGAMADSINPTHRPHTNVLREILKEAKSAITVEEASTSERALKRRTNWTPIKDTEPVETEDTGSTKQETESLSPLSAKNSFANRLVDYAYSENTEPDCAAISMGYASGAALTKRRRIELIGLSTDQASIAAVSNHVQLEKAKAPKKKARTITDLVTAQYVRRDAQLAVPATTSDFFATRVDKNSDTVSTHASDSVSIKPARQKATGQRPSRGDTKKERVPPKSKAKPKLAAAKLLSPGSAIRKMNKQDILFGTSSQLAQEESPSFIQKIQQAICESEAEVANKNNDLVENLHHSTGLSLVKATRSLWAAAARDFGNNTLAAEGSLYKPPSPSKTKFNSVSQDGCGPENLNSSQSRKDFTPTTDKPKSSIFDVERSGSFAAQPQAEIVPNPQAFTDIDEFGNTTPRKSVRLPDFLDIEDFRQHAASVAQGQNSVTAARIPTGKESVISSLTNRSVIASLTKTAACRKLAKDILCPRCLVPVLANQSLLTSLLHYQRIKRTRRNV